jgi:hypothetical protein
VFDIVMEKPAEISRRGVLDIVMEKPAEVNRSGECV